LKKSGAASAQTSTRIQCQRGAGHGISGSGKYGLILKAWGRLEEAFELHKKEEAVIQLSRREPELLLLL
jgi:hypothetical protein